MKKIFLAITIVLGHYSLTAQNVSMNVPPSGPITVSVSESGSGYVTVSVPAGNPLQVETNTTSGAVLSVPAASLHEFTMIVSIFMPTVIYINGVVYPGTTLPLPNGKKYNLKISPGSKIVIKKEDVRIDNQTVKKMVMRITSKTASLTEINTSVKIAN